MGPRWSCLPLPRWQCRQRFDVSFERIHLGQKHFPYENRVWWTRGVLGVGRQCVRALRLDIRHKAAEPRRPRSSLPQVHGDLWWRRESRREGGATVAICTSLFENGAEVCGARAATHRYRVINKPVPQPCCRGRIRSHGCGLCSAMQLESRGQVHTVCAQRRRRNSGAGRHAISRRDGICNIGTLPATTYCYSCNGATGRRRRCGCFDHTTDRVFRGSLSTGKNKLVSSPRTSAHRLQERDGFGLRGSRVRPRLCEEVRNQPLALAGALRVLLRRRGRWSWSEAAQPQFLSTGAGEESFERAGNSAVCFQKGSLVDWRGSAAVEPQAMLSLTDLEDKKYAVPTSVGGVFSFTH